MGFITVTDTPIVDQNAVMQYVLDTCAENDWNIESKSNLMNNRKGILDQIERTIKKNFYRDADDASNYYFERIKRKKEHGAKYTDNILPETEEEFEDNEA